VGLEVEVETRAAPLEVADEDPFHIALLGDFRGSVDRAALDLDARTGVLVDRDNFDDVLAKFAPRLRFPGALADFVPRPALAGEAEISFSSLEDFHPDRLYERLPLFEFFRNGPRDEPPRELQRLSGSGLLERMLEDGGGEILHGRSGQQPARADAGEPMRALMHSAEFQALEAAWRAVFFLVQRLECGPALKLYLFDISKQELAADINQADNLRDTSFFRKFGTKAAGESGWSLLAGNYTFDNSREDVELLARIALLAARAGAPFLAGADPALAECEPVAGLSQLPRRRQRDDDAAQWWQTLREMQEAPYVGLALPRFLLRLPYGKDTAPTESFAFEEMPGARAHEDYLWGNPAVACACLLGQTFQEYGWEMRPGLIRELTGLPLHAYAEGDEWTAKPCSEVQLSDEAYEAILQEGLTPLVWMKGADRILVPRLQSVSDPAYTLAGPWDRH